MEIIYRPAEKRDCAVIAEFICGSSGGISDFLAEGLAGGKTAAEITAGFMAIEARYDSYVSAIVAEYDNRVIGVISSYPANYHAIDQDMQNFLPADRLEHLYDFFNTRIEGSYYLSALYVDKAFRGKGVGGRLIELTKDRARQHGYKELSVIVLADNTPAINLYERSGFVKVKDVAIKEHRLIPHRGGAYLMVCEL